MPTISVKEAVGFAKNAITDLYEDDPLKNLALEEIELRTTEGKEIWQVTLGFYRPRSVTSSSNHLSAFFERQNEVENRVYKVIDIDAKTGDFLKMSMRNAS